MLNTDLGISGSTGAALVVAGGEAEVLEGVLVGVCAAGQANGRQTRAVARSSFFPGSGGRPRGAFASPW